MASSAAVQEKEKGNAAFKDARFADAVGHYTAAIVADPKDHTLPLNRAATYLKLSKNEDAERDCTRVLALNKGNVKALFRRAQARVALQRLGEAQKDLRDAIRLEPNNGAIKNELARVATLLEKGKAREQPRSPVEVAAPPLQPEPPRRRRVPITIVEPEESSVVHTSSPGVDLLTPVSTRPLASSSPSLEPPAKSKPSTFQQAKEIRTAKTGGIRSPASYKSLEPPASDSTTAPSKAVPASTAQPTHLSAPEAGGPDFSLPWTFFTFTRSWNALSSPADRWQLLSRAPPSTLPSLFQTSLETSFLASILAAFHELLTLPAYELQRDDLRRWIREYLVHFPRVPRFGTVVMFMSSSEKTVVREVLREVDADSSTLASWR